MSGSSLRQEAACRSAAQPCSMAMSAVLDPAMNVRRLLEVCPMPACRLQLSHAVAAASRSMRDHRCITLVAQAWCCISGGRMLLLQQHVVSYSSKSAALETHCAMASWPQRAFCPATAWLLSIVHREIAPTRKPVAMQDAESHLLQSCRGRPDMWAVEIGALLSPPMITYTCAQRTPGLLVGDARKVLSA